MIGGPLSFQVGLPWFEEATGSVLLASDVGKTLVDENARSTKLAA